MKRELDYRSDMKVFKVLNNYAGLGGNRKRWAKKILINGEWYVVKVTAVELNPVIAKIYQDFFPDDDVIVGDAAEYLAKHYDEFDFIWASPPCQSHSVLNHINNVAAWQKHNRRLPDMILYSEILYLQHFFKGDWVVENVKPYYKPLIPPSFCLGRHYFWSNRFLLTENIKKFKNFENIKTKEFAEMHGFDLKRYKLDSYFERQILRNCVYPEIGKYIFDKILDVGLE